MEPLFSSLIKSPFTSLACNKDRWSRRAKFVGMEAYFSYWVSEIDGERCTPTCFYWLLIFRDASRYHDFWSNAYQFSSVVQLCPTLCDSMNRSMQGLPVHHQLPESTQTPVHWVSDSIQLSHPLFPFSSCPQSFPSIRLFSNESGLLIRWPKYWSFSFNISPSNEHPALISSRDRKSVV